MEYPLQSPGAAANAVLHLVLLGVAAAFIAFDRRSPTTRALAASFALWGSQLIAPMWLRVLGSWPLSRPWSELVWLPGSLAALLVAEWLVLVLRTAAGDSRLARVGIATLRANQVLTVGTVVLYCTAPDEYVNEYYNAVGGSFSFGFWLFKSLEILSFATLVIPVLLLLRAKVEVEERQRVLAVIVATPFFLGSGLLPSGIANVFATLMGVLVFLVGAMGYHVLKGRRGEFMARFLSPQVRRRIAEQGLHQALTQKHTEISVVCSDLRGFTAYAEAKPAPHVAEVLRRYYDAAGDVAAKYGATIKDFAGDGVLILVGAPHDAADHAQIALALGRDLSARVREVIARHFEPEPPVGVGVGIASGQVMVGVIDSTYRHEYAAVGSAVNLASRLCAVAANGQIRVGKRTAELCGHAGLEAQPDVALKGFTGNVPNYAVIAGANS